METKKFKLKKETYDNNFKLIQKPGTPKGHRSITPNFNLINKCGYNEYKQGSVGSEK